MIARHLPPDEWPRLVGTELETVWPHLNPLHSAVFVVENTQGAIVGCWAAILVPHAEGVWVAPEHRAHGTVAKLLKAAMKTHIETFGAKAIYTASGSPLVTRLLRHLKAVKLPGDQFVFPVEEL